MKKLILISTLVVAGTGIFGTIAYATDPPVSKSGKVYVDKAGMTLYTFDKDAANSGKSVCNGPCATTWPPLAAESGASSSGNFSVIKRDDGTQQWAYKGKPLYLYKADQKPGDRTGDNFKGMWHLVKE
ncbi:MAG TPA: hypothetical protein VIP51_17330 [Eoetvoesiella sp.]